MRTAEKKAYRVLSVPERSGAAKAGVHVDETVYEFSGHDYGCSRDDTMYLGEEYRSYTRDPEGGAPFFTLPVSAVEELSDENR